MNKMLKRIVQKECVPVLLLCALLVSITWGARIAGVREAGHETLGSSPAQAEPAAAESLATRTPNTDILVIAHRGVKMQAPENTLAAIQKAIELGYDYVELDVRFTKDDVPVLMHDPTLDRTTDCSGMLRDYTLEQLGECDAGISYSEKFAGERVPTLKQALKFMQGKIKFYLDQKEAPTEQEMAILRAHDFLPNNINIHGQADAFLALDPEAPVMRGFPADGDMDNFFATTPLPFSFNSDCRTVTKEQIASAHAHGVRVFCNVLLEIFPQEEIKMMRRAISIGVDALQTDRPDVFFPLIEKIRDKAAR